MISHTTRDGKHPIHKSLILLTILLSAIILQTVPVSAQELWKYVSTTSDGTKSFLHTDINTFPKGM